MTELPAVPHLTTALTGPLQHIEKQLLANQSVIERWFREQWDKTTAPIYCSVDLRNAGYKLAPVDTNLFSAGFNNLNPAFHPLGVQAMQMALERVCPKARKILLIPENHTRNLFYLQSLFTLRSLIEQAGYEAVVGTLSDEIDEETEIEVPSGDSLTLVPVEKITADDGDFIKAGNFIPCAVLLNNDLSGGVPNALKGISQQIVPPLELGWASRLKSEHFTVYSQVAKEFAELVDLDPWLLDPIFDNCGEVNFKTREGEDCLARSVASVLLQVKEKYQQYGITDRPFAIVKADAGTYGMGIMTVHSPDEVQGLNKKQRNKMASRKEGGDSTRVIVQEGVPTSETWGDASAEPVVYMIDRHVVGGFYRVNGAKGTNENLNAPGMTFERLAFAEACNTPDRGADPDADANRFYAYGVVGRLAALAAAREIYGVANGE